MDNKSFRLQRIKQQLKRFVALGVALLSLCFFVYLNHSNALIVKEFKKSTVDFFVQAKSFVSAPFGLIVQKIGFLRHYFDIFDENARLRAENEILKGWKETALNLALEQKELTALLNYTPVPAVESQVVRVMGEYNSPFSDAVILGAGRVEGIHKGDVLILNNALFGHVIEVDNHTARALKLTDYFSRLPVFIGEEKILAIMVGDQEKMPLLTALPEEAVLKEGDFVRTAGFAGVYPEGIAVGYLKKEDDVFKVNLIERKNNVGFVRVMHYHLGGLIETTDTEAEKK